MFPDLSLEVIEKRIFSITVPGCSTGSGMIFIELCGTRILTEGDSRFYTQPEVGRWVAPPSVPVAPADSANMAPSNVPIYVTAGAIAPLP
jgi:hypothetical protein